MRNACNFFNLNCLQVLEIKVEVEIEYENKRIIVKIQQFVVFAF